MQLTITLFGSIEITEEDGTAIALPTRKSEALLAYLVAHQGEPVSRESLSDLLWPYSGPDQARASLRQEISVLRKALGPHHSDVIFTQGDRLGVSKSQLSVDLWRFQRWTAANDTGQDTALALYRGPFLNTFRIGSQPFSDWVWVTRQALESQALQHGAAALQHAIDCNETEKIHAIAQHLCRISPTYEPAHHALIRCYIAQNDAHLAQRQLQLCQTVLKSQLDADLSPQTQALVAQIDALQHPKPHAETPTPHAFQQRRSVTVLSIVLNLNISDPEDYDTAARDFGQLAQRLIAIKGGTMLQVYNDRILAVFGYPVTYDDHTDSAILAAFDVLGAVKTAPWGPATCQIGLAHGLALASTKDGPNGPCYDVSGPVVRHAETLAQTAPPGQVLVDSAMRVMPSSGIALVSPDDPSGPLRATLRTADVGQTDQTTLFTKPNHPTVGRDHTTAQARAGLAHAISGTGAAIGITGQPGEGKSRLVQDVADTAQAQGFHIHLFQGAHFQHQSTLAPVVDHIFRTGAFDARKGEAPRAFLNRWLAQTTPALLPAGGYFASLYSMTETGANKADLATPYAKNLALNYFVDLAQDTSPSAPRLLIFEDMQWFDPTTCDAITRLIDVLDGTHTCALFVARDGQEPAIFTHPSVQRITLTALDADSAETLLRGLVKSTFISKATLANVLNRAEGNPLIIEEFAKALDIRESGSETPVGTAFDMSPVHDTAPIIPPPDRLLPLLLSRIDSIPGAIQVLQHASVFGRHFTLGQVAGLMHPMAMPRALFTELETANIVVAGPHDAENTYAFKHALISEAIYSTIPMRARITLHAAAARVLLNDTSRDHDSEVAHHFEKAELFADAAKHYERAGDKAVHVDASAEAISEYTHALTITQKTPNSKPRMRQELALNHKIAAQFIGLYGIPTSAAQPYYVAAEALSAALDDQDEIVHATWGLWSNHLMVAELSTCLHIAQSLQNNLGDDAPPTSRIIVAYMLGVTQAYRGALDAATTHLQTVSTLSSDAMKQELQIRFGMDIALTADSYLGWVHALNGQADLADAAVQRALRCAHHNKSGLSQVFAHMFSATKCLFLDQIDAANAHATKALAGAEKMQFKQWIAQSRMQLARVADLRGDPNALVMLQDAMDAYLQTGMVLARPYAQVWIAEAMIRRNQNAAALDVLDDLQTFTQTSEERYFDSRARAARDAANNAP